MKTIAITGMMGAGKTTIAQGLAKFLNLDFVDIDVLIEKKEQMTISNIFSQKGESFFRQLEQSTIKDVLEHDNQVVSLGGGALEFAQTRNLLIQKSTLIYLKASPKIIYDRIKNSNTRPLLCDKMSVEKIEEILNARCCNYETAQYHIDTDNKTPTDIIKEIAGVLQNDKSISEN